MTSHTAKLTPKQAEALRGILAKRDFESAEVPHAVFSYKRPKLAITWYKSGKLLIQGNGTQEFVEFTLEPEVLGQAAFADALCIFLAGFEALFQRERRHGRAGAAHRAVDFKAQRFAKRFRHPAFQSSVFLPASASASRVTAISAASTSARMRSSVSPLASAGTVMGAPAT